MLFKQSGVPVAALAALALLALGAWAAPLPDNQQTIATRQSVFSIPFTIEKPKNPADLPVEVQLQVSADQGATWQPAGKVKPDRGNFIFKAPHDGEYWFSIRTLDKQGKLRPEGPVRPELRVAVDTLVPRLELTATRGEGGEILTRWQVVDPDLDPLSFKLDYQAGPNDPWQPIATDGPVKAQRHTLSGEATWWAKAGATAITIRGRASDKAGNLAISQVQLKPTDRTATDALSQRPPLERPPLDPTNEKTPSRSQNWPADKLATAPLDPQRPIPGGPQPNAAGDGDWRGKPASQGVSKMISQQGPADRTEPPLDTSSLPPGVRPTPVNSRSFELEYEVDSVGPSGIAKVELWGTRNGGRTWSSMGVDNDNRSPLVATVDGQGVFGFRVVITSGSGLGGLPPRSGDQPEIWTVVDLTRPAAKIIGTEVSATDAGELTVRWEAADEMPDARPISLFYSGRAGGPWSPIASGLENIGSYAWRLDNRTPERIYLRLEMRDEAGNVGAFETEQPISLDRQRPQGRIRSVRPIGSSARNAAAPLVK